VAYLSARDINNEAVAHFIVSLAATELTLEYSFSLCRHFDIRGSAGRKVRPSRPTPLRDGPSALVNSLCLVGGRARLNPVYLSTFRTVVSSLVITFGNALIPPFLETHCTTPALRASSSRLLSISEAARTIGVCRR